MASTPLEHIEHQILQARKKCLGTSYEVKNAEAQLERLGSLDMIARQELGLLYVERAELKESI